MNVLRESPRPRHHERYPDGTFIKTTAFVDQSVVAKRLAVIRCKDNDRIFSESLSIEIVKDPSELIIQLFNHRVIRGLHLFIVPVGRRFRLRLEIYARRCQFGLEGDIAVLEMGTRQRFWVVSAIIFPRRIKRRVRVKRIDTQHPRLILSAVFLNELYCFFGAPVGLMEVGRDIIAFRGRFFHLSCLVRVFLRYRLLCDEGCWVVAVGTLPIGVFVPHRIRFTVVVAILEVAVSVIHALLLCVESTREVEFTD